MDIREEDFPLYQLLVKLNEPGVENAIADFKKAQTGGDEEKFLFALGIQTVAISMETGAADHTQIPGNTPEINNKTLRSARAVFEDVASRGHEGAKYMVESFNARGLGLPVAEPAQPKPFSPKSRNFSL